MITRIVKLTFAPKHIESFIDLYHQVNININNMQGCQSVKLMKDSKYDNIMFTISKWDSEADLNNYRNTDFFTATWKQTKSLFCAKPEAWTLYEL